MTAYVQQQKTAGASAISLGVKSAVLSDEGQTTFNSREGDQQAPADHQFAALNEGDDA